MSLITALAFLAITSFLALALYFMLRRGTAQTPPSKRMAWALAARVGVSIALFLTLLVAWKLGWIHPTGIVVGR